jgi:glycosyltransferase involved in cell wall biosynthesis
LIAKDLLSPDRLRPCAPGAPKRTPRQLPSQGALFRILLRFPRVRILIDYRPALRQRTGVGEFAQSLAAALIRELPAADHLTLFSSSWKDRLPAGVLPGADVVDIRIPVRLLNLAWHRAEWPPVESFAGAVDVAQSLHPLLLPARDAVRFITIHDVDFLDHPERTTAEIRRDYAALAGSHAQRADGILVPSAHTASQVAARLGARPERVTVFPPVTTGWQPRAEPPPGGPILFVGTIEPRKNVPGLIAAYERLAEALADAPPLVLAGRIQAGGESLLRANPVTRARIERRGYVSDEERLRLYQTASMLVLPSFEEGFGIPVVEAMAMGVPVIVSNRGSLPEIAGDAALTAAPDDHAGLASAMQRVLTDAALRRRMVDAGHQRARLYDPAVSARRVLDAYRAAVERRRSRA